MPDPIPTLTYYAAHPCNTLANCKLEQPSVMRQARRFKGPLYKQLLLELYQDGCYRAARHFECLIEEERKLIAKEYERYYVYQKPDFLLKIMDNIKAAEQICRLDKTHGIYMCRKILNQLMVFVEKGRFEWLTVKLYEIVCDYMLKPTKNDFLAREESAKFIFRYSRFLMQRGGDESLRQATIIIPIAMEVSCSEAWKPGTSPEDEQFPTLHAALCSLLAEIYLIKAKQPGITRKRAMKRVQKGLKAIAQVGPTRNKVLAFKALLDKIDILIDASRYDWALKELMLLENSLMKMQNREYLPYKIDFLLKFGISLYNQDQSEHAIRVFSKALKICRKNGYHDPEGDILIHVGQAQKLFPHGQLKARLAFQLAKTHFHLNGDYEKEQKVRFMIGLLKSELIRPNLYKLINFNNYCEFYKLRQWKNLCEPFWEDDKKAGHLTRDTLNSISLFAIHNLHKLYHLILNPRSTFNQEDEEEHENEAESSSTDETTDLLERVVASNLYIDEDSNYDFEAEQEEEAEEEEDYEGVSSDSYVTTTAQSIAQSEVSQMLAYIETISPRRRQSSIGSSARSRRSTLKKYWMPSEKDPLLCLLLEELENSAT